MRNIVLPAVTACFVLLAGCDKAPEQATTMETDSGLKIEVIQQGYGRAAAAGDLVTVHYTGWLADPAAPDGRGDKFDSSVDSGEKFQFPLGAGRVIKGWDEGVEGMLIGEKRVLTIPPGLGYGARGYPPVIPQNATLIFEVELFDAENLGGPDD
ncbi:MAG: FKBP-type peptidyl-prolyl cis-trans isomerase [Woeseiaceae bacterium]|nr:FKBP-type peptidyl-prolyl cis-trans isomerase [Woeseiaceae bacterium]